MELFLKQCVERYQEFAGARGANSQKVATPSIDEANGPSTNGRETARERHLAVHCRQGTYENIVRGAHVQDGSFASNLRLGIACHEVGHSLR